MLKEIVNYVLSNSVKQIRSDVEEFDIIKRKQSDLEQRVVLARRLLVQPYIAAESPSEYESCIKRRVYFSAPLASEAPANRLEIAEHFCNNFNEKCLKYGDTCQATQCPAYSRYKNYAELKRKFDLLTEEKNNFWKNRLRLRQK